MTELQVKINNLLLSLEAHDIHLASVETRLAIQDELINLQQQRIDMQQQRIDILTKRLDRMEKTALEHGDQILKLVNLFNLFNRLATGVVATQQELKELRNEQK